MIHVRVPSPQNSHMPYTVHQLAALAHVSVRTLHHYDKINLLVPTRHPKNDYRLYSEADLLLLQQILFFRELDVSLEEIKRIISRPQFDIAQALAKHKHIMLQKKQRMETLLRTIEKTIQKLTQTHSMPDEELYDGFSKEEYEAWQQEAKERWGETDQYKQSIGKYESLTKEEKATMKKEGDALMEAFVAHMHEAPDSDVVQALVQKHYDALRFFYEPTMELYRNLADMYVGYSGDTRYRAYFERYHKDLPEFIRAAIHAFCDARTE